MKHRFLSIDEIRGADSATGAAIAVCGRRVEALPDRCIRYSFSDSSVGRDMHTIAPDAWDTRNFEANPVFLWAHMDDELPVGRVEELDKGQKLLGLVRYAEHEFAETVYQLVKGDFLNATSTGWLPISWRAANDRNRPGGLDFTRVELLEISQVPVPALPTALVTARSAGIDTRPLFLWAERLLDQGDFAVIGRTELERLRNDAREPISRRSTGDGGQMDDPNTPAAAEKPKPPVATKRDFAALGRDFKKRDLYTLADLCYFLAGVENIYDRVVAEATREEDGSELPAKLRAWIDDGNRLLLDMAGEETSEQIAGTQDDPPSAYYWSAAKLETAIARALDSRGLIRKGAKYSAETIRCLRAVHGHLADAHKQLGDMLDEADPDEPANDPSDDDSERRARDAEERKARAAALKAKHAP